MTTWRTLFAYFCATGYGFVVRAGLDAVACKEVCQHDTLRHQGVENWRQLLVAVVDTVKLHIIPAKVVRDNKNNVGRCRCRCWC